MAWPARRAGQPPSAPRRRSRPTSRVSRPIRLAVPPCAAPAKAREWGQGRSRLQTPARSRSRHISEAASPIVASRRDRGLRRRRPSCSMRRQEVADPLAHQRRTTAVRSRGKRMWLSGLLDCAITGATVHVSPVGMTPAPSIMRITVRSGARVRCITPFGTVNPCRGVSSTVRPSKSITKRPSTT